MLPPHRLFCCCCCWFYCCWVFFNRAGRSSVVKRSIWKEGNVLFNDAHNTFYLRYKEGRKCFLLTTHSTHFIYGYMASDIWYRTTQIAREETLCRHMGYSFRLTARVLLYTPSHRQDSTYHGVCYTSRRVVLYHMSDAI